MIDPQARCLARQILRSMACGNGESATEIALALSPKLGNQHVWIVRAAIAASIEAGNWREVRAEAEAKLREGWSPR